MLLPPHAKHTLRHIKVGIEGGYISSGREQLMNDHPFWRTGDQKRVRPPQAPSVVAPWGSFTARAVTGRAGSLRDKLADAGYRRRHPRPLQTRSKGIIYATLATHFLISTACLQWFPP